MKYLRSFFASSRTKLIGRTLTALRTTQFIPPLVYLLESSLPFNCSVMYWFDSAHQIFSYAFFSVLSIEIISVEKCTFFIFLFCLPLISSLTSIIRLDLFVSFFHFTVVYSFAFIASVNKLHVFSGLFIFERHILISKENIVRYWASLYRSQPIQWPIILLHLKWLHTKKSNIFLFFSICFDICFDYFGKSELSQKLQKHRKSGRKLIMRELACCIALLTDLNMFLL